jgi:CRISPR-associated endonuclease Csn1
MGEKARKEYSKFVSEQTKLREQARKEAEEAGLDGKGAALKLALFKEQGGICIYTGEPLDVSKIDSYEIDHVVPHSRMGPDAPYNRVLTTRHTNNDLKKDKTPFEWLGATSGWESYLERVKGRAGQLRNRKVRLLTSQDAEELVEKYTTLAETAWISRLARAVLDATFGWRNGVDRDGKKRVVFVQGGLTARIRRKYRLNSLLAPAPEGVDAREWESKAEKNRSDKRHHALDAMVINFVPQWARNEAKESFFKFPKALGTDPRKAIEAVIDRVAPRQVAFEKPALADTIFGARKQGPERVIVKRSALRDLAYKGENQKITFNYSYLRKQLQTIRSKEIKSLLTEKTAGPITEEEWNGLCGQVRLPRRDGKPGPRIIKVSVRVGDADEYADLSKDRTGAYRRGKDGHKGQILFRDGGGRYGVAPIYAHASESAMRQQLRADSSVEVIAAVRSGCIVQTLGKVPQANYRKLAPDPNGKPRRTTPDGDLQPDTFTWRTIKTDSKTVFLENRAGQKFIMSLKALAEAGFTRV